MPDLPSLLSLLSSSAGPGLGGEAAAAAVAAAEGTARPNSSDFVASMLSNPALVQAAAANDPRLRALLDSSPGVREALADPEFVRRAAAMAASMFPNGAGGVGGAGGGAAGVPDFSQLASMLGGGGAAGGAGGTGMPDFSQLASMLGGAAGASGTGGGGMPDLAQLAAMLGGGGDGPFSFSLPPVADPETAFATQLSQLEAMGFVDRAASIAALQATGGNVEAAVERLLR